MAYEESYIQLAKRRLSRAYRVLRGRDNIRTDHSTTTGYLLDPTTDQYTKLWGQPLEQDLLTEELLTLLADYPILEAGLRKLTDLDEFEVTVKRAAGGRLAAAKANRIIQRTKKNCELEKELPEIAYSSVGLGNGYVQPAIEGREITDVLLMPNIGFVRNTDHLDRFMPGKPCFIQRTQGNEEYPFNLGQIQHLRYNHRRGQRYGNSIFFSGRAVSKDAVAALRSLLARRLANQPFRVFNVAPGKGIVFTLFQKIRESLSRLVHIQRGGSVSPWDDVFVNNIDVKVAGGEDTNVGDLKDIELLIDCLLMLLGVSRQVLGAGTNVNRDVMDEQREELYKHRRKIIKFIVSQFLKPLFDLSLALEGMNPETVEYSIDFPDLFTDSRMERRIDKLIALFDKGLISKVDAVPIYAPYFNLKDIDGVIQRLEPQPANQQTIAQLPTSIEPETQIEQATETNHDTEDLLIN